MLLFMLSFGLFTIITVFNRPLTNLTKAKEESIPSSDTTHIFVWPLTAKADGNFPVQVNIFVNNALSKPVPNKKVHLSTTLGTIKTNDIVSDQAGKATFTLSSATAGLATITALVDNQVQVKTAVTVKFE